MSATAERAISRIDLSAVRIRKLVSRMVVITPMMPPVVMTRSPVFRLAIVPVVAFAVFAEALLIEHRKRR
jgi:hypothetical protein